MNAVELAKLFTDYAETKAKLAKLAEEIAKEVDTSTTTVTRVADWIFNKNYGGDKQVLKKLYPNTPETSKPSRGNKSK